MPSPTCCLSGSPPIPSSGRDLGPTGLFAYASSYGRQGKRPARGHRYVIAMTTAILLSIAVIASVALSIWFVQRGGRNR
jgi:hypothetical protein